ncbi:MAG TPA: hypothetical protein VEB39_10465 [Sphingomicrobium sp.]|nr:hypothetical protein [Sphingomicrobium sp.]
MSKVALIVDDFGGRRAECTLLLSELFSVPLSAIKQNFDLGLPVGERRLFDRGSTEFPDALMDAFQQLDGFGCRWRAFELLDDDSWDPAATYFQITSSRLANMIASRNESMEQQRRTAELEDDTE